MHRRVRSVVATVVCAFVLASCTSPDAELAETIQVYGPYTGPEADVFAEVLRAFEEQSGIPTSYTGSGSFESDFQVRMDSGDLADVTIIPQLALLGPLVDNELVTPLGPEATSQLAEAIGDWAEILTVDGQALAIPYRFVVKSIVWYRADIFEAEGYQVPETMAELKGLARQMIADGLVPWCGGMDSAVTTGWWATDWVEDLVVRSAGEQSYWGWASLATPFTDGAVVSAMAEFQDIISRAGAVNGGRRGILNVSVQDAIDPMFAEPSGCLMHKQASFQPLWLPSGVEFGDGRLDIFPLPGVEPGNPPMLISGEFAAATSDAPEATQLLAYLFTEAAFEPWLEEGGSLVARSEPNEGDTRTELDRRLAEMVADADVVVLDASDMMPHDVGTEAFFEGMIDLVAGRSASEVAAQIQDAVAALPGR